MNLAEAKEFLNYHIEYVGEGFHPDSDFADYMDRDRGSLYSAENAKEANEKMEEVFEAFDEAGEDIYEYCLNQL